MIEQKGHDPGVKHADHLAAIIVNSEDAIVSKDLTGRILSWNQGAEHMFGYTAKEMIGNSIDLLIPADRKDEEPGILDRIGKGERVEHYETVRLTRTGERLDVTISISPIKDEQGRIIGAAKIARDITARKRAERSLREADMRKNEFLATLAHELRNPLSPLKNGLEILNSMDDLKPDAKAIVQVMDRQLDHMVRLVDDLLDISRISRGRTELHMEHLDLRDVLDQAIESVRPLLDQQQHRLLYEAPAHAVPVHGDRTRLAQVFSNLLNNAAKYTPGGGLIELRSAEENGEVLVEVIDNGAGIPPDELTNIFEMFTQLDPPFNGIRSGLGVGLNLSRQFVLRHGGSLRAYSDGPGKGSRFVVRLPRSHGPTGERSAPLSFVFGRTLRILVVDDNEDAALSLAMVLDNMGHQSTVAHDGEQALRRGAVVKPDLVLMDMNMPVMNGITACKEMRKTNWGKQCMIVAITGLGLTDDRTAAMEAGFDRHLTKPVDRQLIMDILMSAAARLSR